MSNRIVCYACSTEDDCAVDTPSALSLLDTVGAPMLAYRDGPVLYANSACEKLTGRDRATLLGMPFRELAHADDRAKWQAAAVAVLAGEALPAKSELRLVSDAGETRHVELSPTRIELDGEPLIVCFIYDLTEYKRNAARERSLFRLFAQIVDADPVPTFVLNAHHHVTHWNKACAVITGTPADEIVGTTRQWYPFYRTERPTLADLVLSGNLERGFEEFYRGKLRRSELIEGAYEAEAFFPHFGETGRWLYFTAAPLHNAKGQIVGAIETLQDMTARRAAEEALRAQQADLERLVAERTAQLKSASEQLVQSEKMASIGQLAAGVAHEINNPIGYVHSNIGALEHYVDDLFGLLDAYEAAEPAIAAPDTLVALQALRSRLDVNFLKEDIPMLVKESKEGITRVRKIVQDLKDFSHVDAEQEWQWANIETGLDSTLNIASNEIKYKAEVVRQYAGLPEIECLPSQLNQVFMNLLVNAAHAIGDERGTIRVCTRQLDDAHVCIEVEDNGSGMPPEVQKRIFDPFFTTKPVGKGTGLGLSLSYGIVKKHNGRIDLDSTPGKGTTFRITLPVRHVDRGEGA
jgi:PAS domain S-box-containing protein